MRIFLSFSSTDVAAAELLAQALRSRGEVFFSPDSIRKGAFWTPVLADEINKSDAFVLLAGKSGPGPWQLMEYYLGLDRKTKDQAFPFVPVILGAETVGFPFLSVVNYIFADGEAADALAARIFDAFGGAAGTAPEPWRYINPFRDLEALDERSADLFFGRDAETDETVRSFAENPGKIIILLGNSGVGKSSLAKAGVLAAFRRQMLCDKTNWPRSLVDSQRWQYLTMKPGEAPVMSLVDAFLSAWEQDPTDPEVAERRKKWVGLLERGGVEFEGLVSATKQQFEARGGDPPTGFFLYVDQGEEMYRESDAFRTETKGKLADSSPIFSRLLSEAAGQVGVRVLMSMRSDHYGRLQDDTALFKASIRVDVEPLTVPAVECILNETAKRMHVQYETATMPAEIAKASAGEPGAVALISVFLSDMWKAMQARGDGLLSPVDQSASIRLDSALLRRAEGYYAADEARQPAIQRLFVPYLVRVPKAGPPLRKRARISDLTEYSEIVQDLADPDLRLLVTGEMSGEPTAEIGHEVLFKAWPRLNGWVEGQRAFLEWENDVSDDCTEWKSKGRHTNLLLTGGRLVTALEFAEGRPRDIRPEIHEFIKKSKAQDRFWSLMRKAAITLVIVMLMIGGIFAYYTNISLDTRLQAAQRSESLFLAEKAQGLIDDDHYTLALLLALEALPDIGRSDRPLEVEAASALAEAAKGAILSAGPQIRSANPISFATISPDATKIVLGSGSAVEVWDAATAHLIGAPLQHAERVRSATFSPDSTRILTASDDKTAQIWDATTGVTVGAPMLHADRVNSAAFSPDGTLVVTASNDRTAAIWDATTGERIGAPIAHGGEVNRAAFSSNGDWIVTASATGTAQVWDVATHAEIGMPMGLAAGVRFAAFSTDGTKVVTLDSDNNVQVWRASSGHAISDPMQHAGWVWSVAFSPDGTEVLTASGNEAKILDSLTGEQIVTLQHTGLVRSAAFSPDGTAIVTASSDQTVRLWDAVTRDEIGAPIRFKSWALSAAFSADGTRILTTTSDMGAQMWDVAAGMAIGLPMHHRDRLWSAAFSPNGAMIVTASADMTAQVWDATTGAAVGAPMQHQGDVTSAVFSPDGTRIVTASEDFTARVWDATTGLPIGAPMGNTRHFIFSAAFSPDGSRVVTGSANGNVQVWDAATGASLGEPMHHTAAVRSVNFSPDGTRIVSASEDDTARVWDATTSLPIGPPLHHTDDVRVAVFSPDGTRIVTASADKTSRVWDAATGEAIGAPMEHADSVSAAIFSPDGTRILTASRDHTARIWDAASGQPTGALMRHSNWVSSAAFSSDGSRIVTGSQDSTAQVWDAATGAPIGPPMQHAAGVRSVSFSPDGTRIVTASYDSTGRVWVAYSSLQAFIDSQRARELVCLTAEERIAYHLQPVADIDSNPNYCSN